MVSVFQNMLDNKRVELEQARIRYEALQRDVAALEHTSTMKLSPALSAEAPEPRLPKLSKSEKHALRKKQILALFQRHGGTLHLSEVMRELQVSKNAAKDWMNAEIDQAPVACPWELKDGNKSRFKLKDFVPSGSP